MEYLAEIFSQDGGLKHTRSYQTLARASLYCENNSEVGDRCVVSESYKTLTGVYKHSTIREWEYEGEIR